MLAESVLLLIGRVEPSHHYGFTPENVDGLENRELETDRSYRTILGFSLIIPFNTNQSLHSLST